MNFLALIDPNNRKLIISEVCTAILQLIFFAVIKIIFGP